MERHETVYSSDPEGQPRLLLVDAGAVPEVFVRVVEAKRYLQSGEAETAAEAARMAGISRSAFYKYKEAVFPYDEERAGHILTVHLLLRDRPGILSAVLTAFVEAGANILTVTQNLPLDQVAAVTVTIRIDRKTTDLTALFDQLSEEPGVIEFRKI